MLCNGIKEELLYRVKILRLREYNNTYRHNSLKETIGTQWS